MVNSNSDEKLTPAEHAILITILYSDIFSFPLTKDEIWKYLISNKKIPFEKFTVALKQLKQIEFKESYYALKNREEIVIERKKNLKELAKKQQLAKRISEKLSIIPSILFIGISGGLAAGNVTIKDDIDYVIITKKNTLYTTRILILILLQILGVRRFRNQKLASNTICVNLLFDETEIGWFNNNKDVYTAREIAQIIPLFERNSMYDRFLHANSWINHFFPNIPIAHNMDASGKKGIVSYQHESEKHIFSKKINFLLFNSIIETVILFLQVTYMKRHHSNEIITKHFLAFHPNNYRTLVLAKLRLKIQQLGLLTNF